MNTTEDVKIVELLFERDEKVLDQISAKYKGLYKNILKQILNNEEDICECENDVLLAIWNSIPPNRPNNLTSYICKLARNISINKFKHNTRLKRTAGYPAVLEELHECIPDKSLDNCSTTIEQKEINDIINAFVKELDTENRILFIRRYFYLESISSIAKRYKMSENTVSVKLFRAREKLNKILEKEGIVI